MHPLICAARTTVQCSTRTNSTHCSRRRPLHLRPRLYTLLEFSRKRQLCLAQAPVPVPCSLARSESLNSHEPFPLVRLREPSSYHHTKLSHMSFRAASAPVMAPKPAPPPSLPGSRPPPRPPSLPSRGSGDKSIIHVSFSPDLPRLRVEDVLPLPWRCGQHLRAQTVFGPFPSPFALADGNI